MQSVSLPGATHAQNQRRREVNRLELNAREIALLHQCIEHSLSHIEEIEDITDEHIEDELKALKNKLETKK
jgi:hypothetical protein